MSGGRGGGGRGGRGAGGRGKGRGPKPKEAEGVVPRKREFDRKSGTGR